MFDAIFLIRFSIIEYGPNIEKDCKFNNNNNNNDTMLYNIVEATSFEDEHSHDLNVTD